MRGADRKRHSSEYVLQTGCKSNIFARRKIIVHKRNDWEIEKFNKKESAVHIMPKMQFYMGVKRAR